MPHAYSRAKARLAACSVSPPLTLDVLLPSSVYPITEAVSVLSKESTHSAHALSYSAVGHILEHHFAGVSETFIGQHTYHSRVSQIKGLDRQLINSCFLEEILPPLECVNVLHTVDAERVRNCIQEIRRRLLLPTQFKAPKITGQSLYKSEC